MILEHEGTHTNGDSLTHEQKTGSYRKNATQSSSNQEKKSDAQCLVIHAECTEWLRRPGQDSKPIDLTFLDPPFNQGKAYTSHNDDMCEEDYWLWMKEICQLTRQKSSDGAGIYFMQREKNCEQVLRVLRESGWTYQNLIIWKKKTSAVPSSFRLGKSHQIIVFATNGRKPRVFNKLRIDPPLPAGYKPRENGMLLTDVWDDIREMTSGYFAGEEALRNPNGSRAHNQQSPIALLLRIILCSSSPGDLIFDPFAGTATTGVVSSQIGRNSICLEKDAQNFGVMTHRVSFPRASDSVNRFLKDYTHTDSLVQITGLHEGQKNRINGT